MQPQQCTGLLAHLVSKRVGDAARIRAHGGKFTGQVGSADSPAGIAARFATVLGLVAPKQPGNLRDVVLGIYKAVSLIFSHF